MDRRLYYSFAKRSNSVFMVDNDRGVLVALYIFIDLNGNKKPNMFGKDVFVMQIVDGTSKPLLHGADYSDTRILNDNRARCSLSLVVSTDRSGYLCGGWIQKNGWKIPDGYPW